MSRHLMAVVLLCAVAMPAHAGWILGLEGGNFRHQLTVTSGSAAATGDDSGSSGGLKIGYQGKNLRGYAAVHVPRTESDDLTILWGTFSIDWLSGAPADTFRIFLGGNLGSYGYYWENYFANGDDFEMGASTMGIEGGLLLQFDPIQLELGHRYAGSGYSDDNAAGFDLELDNVSVTYLGVNYHF